MGNNTNRMSRTVRAAAMTAGLIGLLSGSGLVVATSASAADGATIVGTETAAAGRTIILRQGTYDGVAGFGWTKTQKRHAIFSKNSIGFVLKNPDGGVDEGEDRRYTAYANEITCTDEESCTVTDSREVRVVNKAVGKSDWYGVALGGEEVGIITAYCLNPDGALACPSWVDLAIGVKKPSTTRLSEGSPTSTSTSWSYEPMSIGQDVP
ncbi:hypothetical protein PED38_08725 [Clavibacter sp. CT19]|uniref:hypothetical protein n=1 Tax=Clavibacter sp. CT19 TaxID=3018990 RepID=UPI0022EAD364|nr:hypothetical protein [Clavibacter sp. CT19]MDA3804879.1 hypothetical protein [Clavibacter sp. CT19]